MTGPELCRPRLAQRMGKPSGSPSLTSSTTAASAGPGTAMTSASAPRRATSRLPVAVTPEGRRSPGNRRWFSRRRLISVARAGVRLWITAVCPLRAKVIARLVANAPAPRMAICMALWAARHRNHRAALQSRGFAHIQHPGCTSCPGSVRASCATGPHNWGETVLATAQGRKPELQLRALGLGVPQMASQPFR